MTVTLTRRRFTVDAYHRMVEAGILDESDRVELIRGEVVEMTPIGRRHAGRVDRLTRLFTARLGERAIVRVQGPLPLLPDSEPQPDVTVLRPSADFYEITPIGPPDVLLVVEVADTSVASDRAVKVPMYAEAGVSETWLVDLAGDRLEVYRRPTPTGYRESQTLGRGEVVAPELCPELVLAVDEILG